MKAIESLLNQGKLDEAEKLTLKTPMAETYRTAILASIEMRRGDLQKAEVLFERVLKADPNHVVARGNLGQLLLGQNKRKQALPHCEFAYRAAPKNEVYALNYAACLADADRVTEATEVLRPYAEAPKPSMRVLTAQSSLLRADLKASEALILLERLRSLYPDDPEADRAYADAMAELDPYEASAAFKLAESKAKNKVPLRWNWSFVELRLRNFSDGWVLYENGLDDKVGKIGRPLPAVVKAFKCVTDLEKLDPRKYTLFTCEQGIGDQILFLGIFEKVIKRFPKSMLIAEDRMIPVLQRAFPEVPVVTYGFAYSLSRQQDRINGVFPIGSLQKCYRGSVEDFNLTKSIYLKPDGVKVKKYRDILERTWPGRTLVGLSWTGGFWDRQKKTKSFPFAAFKHLMNDPKYCFVALQYGDVAADKEYSKSQHLPVTFIDGIDFKKDLDSWFSLICACDRIVSVSTALVHFAGAAGMRVDVLMGQAQGPFIWGVEDGPSIAYQDVHTWRMRTDEEPESFMQRMAKTVL